MKCGSGTEDRMKEREDLKQVDQVARAFGPPKEHLRTMKQ